MTREKPTRQAADRVFKVLFLCTGNSARSIMAEAILNREGGGSFEAYSAGSNPKGAVNPHAVALLKSLGHDISGFRSKSWDELGGPGAPHFDFIFTVCDQAAGESCPIWPGHPMTVHWGIPDPALATGKDAEIALAFDDAYRLLATRIGVFTALPIATLDRVALDRQLREIGAMEGAKDKAKGCA
jgi:arsenate reductase